MFHDRSCAFFFRSRLNATQIVKWSFGAHDRSHTFDRWSFYDRSCSVRVRNVSNGNGWSAPIAGHCTEEPPKNQVADILKKLLNKATVCFYICLCIIWCNYFWFLYVHFNIDVGVVRWPPARSCGCAVMGDARPSLFICAVMCVVMWSVLGTLAKHTGP